MTCIAGLVKDGIVYLGGDSAGVNDWDLTVRKDQKIFINGEFLIGFSSSFRMGQLLQYKFDPPIRHNDMDIFRFMVSIFVERIRACFHDGGYQKRIEEREIGGQFLIGYAGRLFHIDSDYQVGEAIDNMLAIGCGANVAIGALYVLRNMNPIERIERALEAAERFNGGVRSPFVIKSLPEQNNETS